MPASDSAICAVTAAIRLRTSPNATDERTWNQRENSSAGGITTSATSASRQSTANSAAIATTNVSEFAISVFRPSDSTSERASMSLVSRAMIQPAFVCEKYRSESVVRCPNRCRRSSSTIPWPTAASPRTTYEPSAHETALMAT